MIQNVLRELGGVGIYGVISVCLFFLVFTIAMIWALARKKSFLNSMSLLPLQDDRTPERLPGENSHE